MILMLDNYDSFTWNIVQALQAAGADVRVERNDAVTVEQALAPAPDAVVVSPGPGTPERAGISVPLIRACLDRGVPLLGVCLGHQALAVALGGRVERAARVMHGKTSRVYHDGRTLYRGLSNPFVATRSHSLIVPEDGVPDGLEVSAYTAEGEVMGLRVPGRPAEGVQFHPESILTDEGPDLLRNFLRLSGEAAA